MLHGFSDCTSTTVYDTTTTVPAGFIDSLVKANLQPVMQALDDVDTFLESLRPAISRIASELLYGYQPRDTEIDDLVQEGMIAAWQASSKSNVDSLKSYCLTSARYAMLSFIKRHSNTIAIGLDDTVWLMMPAKSEPTIKATPARERKRINTALNKLSRLERLAVKAEYGLCSSVVKQSATNMTRQTAQRYFKSRQSYSDAKRRATRKLAILLQPTV